MRTSLLAACLPHMQYMTNVVVRFGSFDLHAPRAAVTAVDLQLGNGVPRFFRVKLQ